MKTLFVQEKLLVRGYNMSDYPEFIQVLNSWQKLFP
jgi:hypothetical protein